MTTTDSANSTRRIQRIGEFKRPTSLGEFYVVCYLQNSSFAFAVTRGSLGKDDLLVRVQSPCLFGESFAVNSCDCGAQLTEALKIGSAQDDFLLVYPTDQEGRGLGLFQKIKAIQTEVDQGVDMAEAFRLMDLPHDLRDYRMSADIIRDLNGDRSIRLMTNNPKKAKGLREHGVTVSEKLVPLLIDPPNIQCRNYLAGKKHKMGHILPHID
jgi:3,4-dihydroxy 2-butanone 4-phosphate synthase/GTP cyclohydrolase II